MLGCGGDPLFGADDVGDAHEVVVDDVGEVVGGEAVGLEQDLVVDVEVIEGDVAAQFVAESRGAGRVQGMRGDFEADGEGLAAVGAGLRLLGAEVAGAAGVFRGLLGGHLRLALGFELFRSFEGAVGVAAGEQLVGVLAIDFGAFGLAIGAARAADVGAFIPTEAEPAQGIEDHLLAGVDEAGAVGVLDAQDELAAALGGEDVVEQADVGGADVRVAGGGRSDADADGSGRCAGFEAHGLMQF